MTQQHGQCPTPTRVAPKHSTASDRGRMDETKTISKIIDLIELFPGRLSGTKVFIGSRARRGKMRSLKSTRFPYVAHTVRNTHLILCALFFRAD